MGKPRMIILVRHAQSEGNKNRDIHQFVPDHRVKLTAEGQIQAEEAGRRLRSMLHPDDTIQFFTSPYRRTRETTEGILKTLTCDDPEPSPFPQHTITVFEEPRLREQDFGNFQPCSAEMERMWQERADYGHFFYRIPNGESAADAYDRVSGFNESLWRSFADEDFPSVCVLVTHGLMTRVFLMKWYHWSVEYFEDLRNVNHCEFIVMKQNEDGGKYILQNELRTWSDLKRRSSLVKNASSATVGSTKPREASPAALPTRQWGGCVNGCSHGKVNYPRRARRQNTGEVAASKEMKRLAKLDAEAAAMEQASLKTQHPPKISVDQEPSGGQNDTVSLPAARPASSSSESDAGDGLRGHSFMAFGRDFGGSRSGVGTPAEILSDDSDYFNPSKNDSAVRRSQAKVKSKSRLANVDASGQWASESGMGTGAMADKLGDGEEEDDDEREHALADADQESAPPTKGDAMRMALREADDAVGPTTERVVEAMKERDRKSMNEIY